MSLLLLQAFLPVLVDYCLGLGMETSMVKLSTLNKLARFVYYSGDVLIHCNHLVAIYSCYDMESEATPHRRNQ